MEYCKDLIVCFVRKSKRPLPVKFIFSADIDSDGKSVISEDVVKAFISTDIKHLENLFFRTTIVTCFHIMQSKLNE